MPQRQRKRPARRGPDLRWPAPGTRHAGRQRAPGTPGRQRPRGPATRRAAHAASPSQRATLRRDPPARVAGVDGEVARGPPFPHSTCRAGRAGRLACPRHGGSRAIGAGAGPDFTHLRRAGTRAPPARLGQQWRCPNRQGELTQAGIPLFAAAEPIDVADADATTILVRRVKQGAAECSSCRSEKARAGLQEHALRGFNNRPHPRRHQVAKIPHAGPPSVRKAAPRPGSASTLTAPPWSSRCSPGALRRAPGTGS